MEEQQYRCVISNEGFIYGYIRYSSSFKLRDISNIRLRLMIPEYLSVDDMLRVIGSGLISIGDEYVSLLSSPMKINLLVAEMRYGTMFIPGENYLDIPLLFDFFLCGQNIPSERLVNVYFYSTIQTEAYMIPDPQPTQIDSSSECFPVIFCPYNGSKIYMYQRGSISNICEGLTKFIMITVYRTDDTVECPEIIDLIIDDKDSGKTIVLDPTYFYVKEYPAYRLYIISPDPEANMREWTNAPAVYLPFSGLVISFDRIVSLYGVDIIMQKDERLD